MKRILSILAVVIFFLFIALAEQPEKKYKAPNFSLRTQDNKVIELV